MATLDETIPVAAHYEAVSTAADGWPIGAIAHSAARLGHGIDEPGLIYCQEFLAKALADS